MVRPKPHGQTQEDKVTRNSDLQRGVKYSTMIYIEIHVKTLSVMLIEYLKLELEYFGQSM